jgi:type IV secretion/conjugal transfer VirB4 family ATPase
LQITEHRCHAVGLADLLLYDSLIDDGVLLLQDGALLAGWSFRGPDMASATHEEMAALCARLSSIMRLGAGWMIQCDAIRCLAPGYPEEGHFPDTATRIIDAERREQFMAEGAHFESDYFLTLTFLPPAAREEKVKGWLFDGTKVRKASALRALEYFEGRIANFEDVFSSLLSVSRLKASTHEDGLGYRLVHDSLLRYVHRCITGLDHPFVQPEIPVFLNQVLASQDFVGGIEPRIGEKHLRVVAIDGFPKASYPGVLGILDGLPIEFRWNTRAILMDPEEARSFLDKTRKKWKSRIRGFKDTLFRTETGPINLHAQEMALDAEEAMSVAAAGDVQFAFYASNIICAERDEDKLEENVALVAKTVRNAGYSARLETVNAVEAWRGSLPGDGYSNVRQVVLHTMNLADVLPITSVWAGRQQNPSALMPPNSPPLLYAATTGATPFRFNMHVSDLGHTLMVGPPGSGKSTALGLVAAQWFRYPKAQVFAFDKGRSLYVLCRAADGEFYELGGEGGHLAFCPLKDLDDGSDVSWAVDWLEKLCALNGLHPITPQHRNAITNAVKLMQQADKRNRTLTDFCATVQQMEVREALELYTLGGAWGQLLDAKDDSLGFGRFMVFEMEKLMTSGEMNEKAVTAVLLYLFRQIEKRLDGSPTLIPLDEAWVYLRHALFRDYLRDWLKTLRKKNAAVLLATQNLSDVFNSQIKDVVLESCPTKILLPNAEASNPASRGFYESVGLNDREIEIIQTALPKRQYYVVSPEGRRLISLGLGGVALSFVGVNGQEERDKVDAIIATHPENWREWWLRERGLMDWAEWIAELEAGQHEVLTAAAS